MSVYYITNNSIDNFKEVLQIVYAGIEDHILTEEEMIEQHKVDLYKDTTIYIGNGAFSGYPIRQGDSIRPATKVELVEMGYQKLGDGEYISNTEIVTIKRPNYYAKWNKELNQWETDPKVLREGEVLKEDQTIEHIPQPNDYSKWDKDSGIWVENLELKKEKYFSLIERYKEETLNNGFDWNGHQQRCRKDIDVALLTSQFSKIALKDRVANVLDKYNTPDKPVSLSTETPWAFNDGDVVTLTEDEIIELYTLGDDFCSAVYMVEAYLKALEINLDLTLMEFKSLVEEKAIMKCYK